MLVDELFLRAFPDAKQGFRYLMGDDTIKEDDGIPDDLYLNFLRRLGLIAKLVERKFEFCGFDAKKRAPTYKDRHIWRLSYTDPSVYAETLVSYRSLYHQSNDEMFKQFLKTELANIDPTKVMSDYYLDNLCFGYE